MKHDPITCPVDVGGPCNCTPMDITIHDGGSIVLFRPVSEHAKTWLADNVEDGAQYLGDALACERRYAGHLLEGLEGAGLVVGHE